MIYLYLTIEYFWLLHQTMLFLDSEWSDECIDFTFICVLFVCLSSFNTFWDSKNSPIFFNGIFYGRKVNLVNNWGVKVVKEEQTNN